MAVCRWQVITARLKVNYSAWWWCGGNAVDDDDDVLVEMSALEFDMSLLGKKQSSF